MKVSIIIPVYNIAPYIGDCLRSVMNQTYQGEMECLLIDDCGLDDSIAIAERMIYDYKGPIQFQIRHHEYNQGLSSARNTGMAMATGDYLYFLDGDDEMTSDCIEKLVAPIEADGTIDVVQGNYVERNKYRVEKTKEPYQWRVKDLCGNERIRDFFFVRKEIPVTAWNKLIRVDFLRENNLGFMDGLLYEDALWSYYMMKYIKHLYLVHDVTYFYNRRKGSIVETTPSDVIQMNKGVIYKTIASGLSGKEKAEVHYFLHGFCFYLIDCYQDANYQYAYGKFKEVLANEGPSIDRLLLSVIHMSLKTAPTRFLVRNMKNKLYIRFFNKDEMK